MRAISGEAPIAVIQLLLDHGADVNAKDNLGETALNLAQGDPSVVQLLQSAGAK